MAGIPDLSLTSDAFEVCADVDDVLPDEPFTALRFHFGMLLGVQDFETLAAQPRAKMRLHNAWLHREGVIWGLDVSPDTEAGELRVEPGLGVDGSGRELHLDGPACVDVGAWFDLHRSELDVTEDGPRVTFAAHVVARFRSCLSRQVPALAEPCEGGGGETAYSRIVDTVELLLLPELDVRPAPPYHRLRVLFGLEPPDPARADDQKVVNAIAAVAALPAEEQAPALLEQFRRFAALDTAKLGPAEVAEGEPRPIVPARADATLLLANVSDIVLERTADGLGWKLVAADVDTSVRPSHVATATIQELLCRGPAGAVAPAPAPDALGAPARAAAAGGGDAAERVGIASVAIDGTKLTLTASGALAPASVRSAAVSVSTFDDDAGWSEAAVEKVSYRKRATAVVVDLRDAPTGLLRVIARGTGPTPLLAADLLPLAGAAGDSVPSPHDGRDYVHMEGIES
jgi:hypothetical protein